MNRLYHRQLTTHALAAHFHPPALETIIQANLHQDDLKYLLGAHPHYHFDDNAFARTHTYLDELQAEIAHTLAHNHAMSDAWQAFGKITHTVQDFYAHSNYVQLWLEQNAPNPDPETIAPLIPALLTHPQLITGRVVLWVEIIGLIPFLGRWLAPLFPADTHLRMNLDEPRTGPLFPYAMAAARKRTEAEFETLAQHILTEHGPQTLAVFLGKSH